MNTVDRLAEKWRSLTTEIDFEADDSPQAEARWWMREIAEEIDAEWSQTPSHRDKPHPPSRYFEISRWLRQEAEK